VSAGDAQDGQGLPVGTVLGYAGGLPGDLFELGWLHCDGTTRLGDEYGELYQAIGYAFGVKSVTRKEFFLPDLRGMFVRATCQDQAKRDKRDPEWRERRALMEGGNIGASVGSYQGYGTAKPRNAFKATISELDISRRNDAAGCGTNPASYDGSITDQPALTGGDVETRPNNKYCHFIIKSAALTKAGKPVIPPPGAVIAFAGRSGGRPPAKAEWEFCNGRQLSRIGEFAQLYEAIRYAHGGGGNDFRLPDYQGWFQRGVSGSSTADPDRNDRPEAAPGGNKGNSVGSRQDWATALPAPPGKPATGKFEHLPTRNQGKLTDSIGPRLARLNDGSVTVTLNLGTSGDAETRPENLSANFYIRSQEGTQAFPIGGIIMTGTDLPEGQTWMRCDGRHLKQATYRALYDVIGGLYGSNEEEDTFALPDYGARFLRGASGNTGTDPDARSRLALGDGDPGDIASLQLYATAPPRKEFVVSIKHLPTSTVTTGGGARTGAAAANGGKTVDPWDSGGNGDTRPVNVYLSFYIRVT
jgi:microcystin-dependent protein